MSTRPSARRRPAVASPGPRIEASVRWFNQIHGIGVAHAPGLGQIHVHYRELREGAYRALDAGDTISCWIETTSEGPVARAVEVVASLPRE